MAFAVPEAEIAALHREKQEAAQDVAGWVTV